MPTYIRKTIKILPWVTLNISKTGVSLSIGPKGAKLNIGKKGAYVNTTIPGTGVYNKTKVGTSLLWGLGTCALIVGIGYIIWLLKKDIDMLIYFGIAGLVCGIIAFFIARSVKKVAATEEETVVRAPSDKKATTPTSNKTSNKTATKPAATTKKGTRTGNRTTTRTENASAKAYIDEVTTLLGKMADAKTLDELNKHHTAILDIMYTNLKPLGVKVLDMEFDEAMATIEQEYAEGVKQLSNTKS